MEGLILGVNTMYMLFCFFKLFLIGCIGLMFMLWREGMTLIMVWFLWYLSPQRARGKAGAKTKPPSHGKEEQPPIQLALAKTTMII